MGIAVNSRMPRHFHEIALDGQRCDETASSQPGRIALENSRKIGSMSIFRRQARVAMSAAGIAASLAAVALSAPSPVLAQTQPTVSVSVMGVETQRGNILVALYDEASWGETAVALGRAPVTGEVVAVEVRAPGTGRYAVRLFHDIDGDNELDANLLGIPTEPFGFSNDAPLRFGPPAFADAAFDVSAEGARQSITLR
jgi:uncharacterized protein (DUF2141 family)